MLPNSAVLSWFSKARVQNFQRDKRSIMVWLDQLNDADISPLIDTLGAVDSSELDAVDIVLHESPSILSEEDILCLMNAVKLKLRVVDLRNMSPGKDFLGDLCRKGLSCHVLHLRSNTLKSLNMVGRFVRLHTLNLDFCTSLASLQKDCFSCMPNLMCLSMCETRVVNLWTTAAALSKLPSLVELRFQNCLCCTDTGACPASPSEKEELVGKTFSSQLNICLYDETPFISPGDAEFHTFGTDEKAGGLLSLKESFVISEVHKTTDDSPTVTGTELPSYLQKIDLLKLSTVLPTSNGHDKLYDQTQEKDELLVRVHKLVDLRDATTTPKGYSSHHPSPICFEKHYREYLVASLTRLEVLDNLPIKMKERELARTIFSKYYEQLPYKRSHKESVTSILQKREIGTSGNGISFRNSSKSDVPSPFGKSQISFSRSLIGAKFRSSAWPQLRPLSSFNCIYKEENKRLRPRQFEYHPSNSGLMAFGTLDGEVVVINHENGNVVSYIPSTGAMNSVLGLCWLKKHPSKLVAGSDNGCLKLFDISRMPPRVAKISRSADVVTYDDFEQLTSVHVNSTDDQFLASGYSKNVALYDVSSGKRLQLFTNLHQEPINVAKFAHHSPFLFATSSFDNHVKMWDLRQKPTQPCYTASSSRGNVMVCFSPDDHCLLVSSIDNEVKQLYAADGRLHTKFDITSTGSAHNYTRSYYINGGDYIISGSCDEHAVHICCTQTGRRLRDVYLEDRESGNPMFVQSLRGDPFRPFHMSVLAASTRFRSKWEIMEVNLLASNHRAEEYSSGQNVHSSYGMGG